MNYVARYGLEYNPFEKNSKESLVMTTEYKEMVFRLDYLLNTKGFGLITGNPGRGKTTIVRNWAKELNPAAYKVVYIALSTLTVMEFYRILSLELGMEAEFRKVNNFKNIQSAIRRYKIEKKITPVIILDEANYLPAATLNDLKILFNFDMDSQDMAVVILMGLPQLNNTLRLTAHEPLRQRITMNYNVESLSKEETKKYIEEKLKMAGSHQTVFENNAIEAIANGSNGVVRIIDKVCNACMLIGNNRNKNIIDADIIMEALNDIELG